MRPRSMAKSFAGTVKEVLGTVKSVGVTVEGQDPVDLTRQVDEGAIEIPDA